MYAKLATAGTVIVSATAIFINFGNFVEAPKKIKDSVGEYLSWGYANSQAAELAHQRKVDEADRKNESYDKIIRPLQATLKSGLHGIGPSNTEIEAAYRAGHDARALEVLRMQANATKLESDPALSDAAGQIVGTLDEAIECKGTTCDDARWDIHFKKAICRYDRSFHTWIEQKEQGAPRTYRRFLDYVSKTDCAGFLRELAAAGQMANNSNGKTDRLPFKPRTAA